MTTPTRSRGTLIPGAAALVALWLGLTAPSAAPMPAPPAGSAAAVEGTTQPVPPIGRPGGRP